MAIKPVTVNQCTCERCGYVWISEIIPVRCAKCRDPAWSQPRIRSKRGSKSNIKDPKRR